MSWFYKIFLLEIGCCLCLSVMPQSVFPSLEYLDKIVENGDKYVEMRETRILQIKKELANELLEEKKYSLKNQLFNEYASYNVDSAYCYAESKLLSAFSLKKQDFIDDAKLNLAYVFIQAGSYKEAWDMLHDINRQTLFPYLEKYYYTIYISLYDAMLQYAISTKQSEEYHAKLVLYRDSILQKRDSMDVYIYANQLLEQGNYNKGLSMLLGYYEKLPENDRKIGATAYLISDFYRRQGKRELEKRFLIISAISDIKWAIKEYISLRRLATILYEEGDLKRAYKYMRRSLNDAVLCNARLRTIEVTHTLPVIDKAYQLEKEKGEKRLRYVLIGISVLSLILMYLLCYVRKQMRKLTTARNELEKANEQLKLLNADINSMNIRLQETNSQLSGANGLLQEMNQSLSEANNIKVYYITRFMTECSAYIDKLDNYRRLLNKKSVTGKIEDLFKILKSSTFIETELTAFYVRFDETFLCLFPSFVEEFNMLLPKQEWIVPKKEGSLTTELRIYALIRLGINDSEQIASFLRYSKATIYSYRSRIRLKSLSPDIFEEQIMKIPSI